MYVFAGHVVQLVVLPKPYVPGGQNWHEKETPSTKYCPAPQQMPIPLCKQRTNEPLHDAVHETGMDDAFWA